MADEQRRGRPVFHVIAGPNGAGKSTLYETTIKPAEPGVEFVNADQLAWAKFGHAAQTPAEAAEGQRLAEDRRQQLMAERKSLITETTFSHPSKLDLLQEARAMGYELRTYHVNVRTADMTVARVQHRVTHGGHPVPEDKIRERYARNQELIRDAVRMSDRAKVFDNSKLGARHEMVLEYRDGRAVRVGEAVPVWAQSLYAEDLTRLSEQRFTTLSASFAQAQQLAANAMGENARTYIAQPGRAYSGEIIGQTSQHVVQRLGPTAVVAHLASRLPESVALGSHVRVAYPDTGTEAARIEPIAQLRAVPAAAREAEPARITVDLPHAAHRQQLEPIRRVAFGDSVRAEVQEQITRGVEANPEVFLARFRQLPQSLDGRFISADTMKETFPQYAESPAARNLFNAPAHNAAAVLASEQLRRVLAEPAEPGKDAVVLLTGIPGAGKTTAVLDAGKLLTGAHAVYEGQLANPEVALSKVQQVIDAGFKPVIMAVHTLPERALDNTLQRFNEVGRGASINVMAKIQAGLPEGLQAVRDKFGDAVDMRVYDRREFGEPKELRGWNQLPLLQSEGNHDQIKQRLSQHLEHQRNRLSEDGYRQAAGMAPIVRERSDGPGAAAQHATTVDGPGTASRAGPSAGVSTEGLAPAKLGSHLSALEDPRFREQIQGLADITAALNGTGPAPAVRFSTDERPSQRQPEPSRPTEPRRERTADGLVDSIMGELGNLSRRASNQHLGQHSSPLDKAVFAVSQGRAATVRAVLSAEPRRATEISEAIAKLRETPNERDR